MDEKRANARSWKKSGKPIFWTYIWNMQKAVTSMGPAQSIPITVTFPMHQSPALQSTLYTAPNSYT